jgi:hypothetical protein
MMASKPVHPQANLYLRPIFFDLLPMLIIKVDQWGSVNPEIAEPRPRSIVIVTDRIVAKLGR